MTRSDHAAVPQRRRALLAAVAVAAGAAGVWLGWRRLEPAAHDAPASTLWQQSFETPAGAALKLASLQGSRLLLNFWAPWCAPCVEELPMLDAFYRARRSQGWNVVGLAVDQPAAVQRFLQRTPLSFPIALAGLGGIDIARQLGNTAGGLPFTVLFDRGRVAQRKLGQLSADELERWATAG